MRSWVLLSATPTPQYTPVPTTSDLHQYVVMTFDLAGSSVEVNTAVKPAPPQDEDLTGSRPRAPISRLPPPPPPAFILNFFD
jgi:hypothetical protein